MRGAYYVALALLVTASAHRNAKLDQAKSQQALHNDFVTSGGTAGEVLPRRILRESHDPKDKLPVYAGAEERVFERPPQALEQAIKDGVMRMDAEAVMARAAEAIKAHKELDPWLMGRISKRQRVDPTPFNTHGQALQAVPRPRNHMVPVASDVPANRAKDKAPTVIMNNAARSAMEHNFFFAPSNPSTSSALNNIRPNKQSIALKTFDFDAIKHLDEVDIRNSERQRTNPTPANVIGQALQAHRKPEDYIVSVGSDVASLLAKRLKKKKTAIMSNAADIIKGHDFHPASVSPSTSSVVSNQPNNQLVVRKTLEFDMNKHPNELQSHGGGHQLHMRGGNDNFEHPEVLNRQSVSKDGENGNTRGPIYLRNNVEINDEVRKVHAEFLKAFNLPFHQYLEETAKMLSVLKWKKNSGPGHFQPFERLMVLIKNQKAEQLELLLRLDLEKLLGKGVWALERNKKNLREAYSVKLAIMYELFFDFCYTRPDLFKALPQHAERRHWIVKLLTATGGSSNYPFPLLH